MVEIQTAEPVKVETPAPPPPPPPALTEQQITEEYLAKRAKGETADLPIPAPTVPETKVDITVPEQQTVDAYLAERGERKRKERGGKQARIDELTKEKAELAAKVKAAEAKPPETKPPEVAPASVVEPAKPVESPKAQPKMADYTDVDKYNADMALWAASQTGKAIAEPPKEPPKPEPVSPLRKEEFDRFLERGKVFIAGHPDFNTTLEAAHVRGLTMSEGARIAITKLAAPEVAYWLAKPENDLAARKFMGMDEMAQITEVGRVAERLAVKPADFVSSAPGPGLRLTGNQAIPNLQLNEITDTDEYIRQRKLQRRGARGR